MVCLHPFVCVEWEEFVEFDNVGLELSINFEEFSEESDVVWCRQSFRPHTSWSGGS